MCHVYDNPKHLLGHVDSLMKEVEKSADDDEIRRIIESIDYHVYEGDLDDPEYETKWNAIFEALTSFVKLLRDRREVEYIESEKKKDSEKRKDSRCDRSWGQIYGKNTRTQLNIFLIFNEHWLLFT